MRERKHFSFEERGTNRNEGTQILKREKTFVGRNAEREGETEECWDVFCPDILGMRPHL